MPKRSNDFQRLVKVIHDALSKIEGATVTESAMLPEPDGTLREVDILLERSVAGVPIRLAIECRDRSRKSDVEWIDGLVGKFRNLTVDKVVAVCRKGFSGGAVTKAAANKIELRVLSECLADQWANEFMKLGFAVFHFQPELHTVEVTLDPPLANAVEPSSPVECGEEPRMQRTLEQLVNACFIENVAPRLKHHVEQEFLAKLPPLAELSRQWDFTVPVEVRDSWLLAHNGTRHRITQFLFGVSAKSEAEVSSVRHYQYGTTALASEGQLNIGSEVHKMRVIQVAGQTSLTTSITKSKK